MRFSWPTTSLNLKYYLACSPYLLPTLGRVRVEKLILGQVDRDFRFGTNPIAFGGLLPLSQSWA